MTILIADDDPSNLLLVKRISQQTGYGGLRSTEDSRDAPVTAPIPVV